MRKQHLMQGTNVDVVLVLGAFAGMLVAFYKIIESKDKQSALDREADRKERNELTDAMKGMAASSQLVAEATQKGAREAKERNGHLGEQNLQIAELVTNQNKDVAKIKESNQKIAEVLSKSALIAAEDRGILTGGPQLVNEQIVNHQTVKESK